MYVNLLDVVTEEEGKKVKDVNKFSSSVSATGELECIGEGVSIKIQMMLIFNILDWKMLGEE